MYCSSSGATKRIAVENLCSHIADYHNKSAYWIICDKGNYHIKYGKKSLSVIFEKNWYGGYKCSI